MKIINLTPEEWDQELAKIKFHTFFHTIDWLQLVQKNHLWLTLNLNKMEIDQKEILFPYFQYKKKIISLPFCEYGGPISNSSLSEEDVLEVLSEFEDYNISIHPFSFQKSSKMSTFIINLNHKTKEDLLQSFRKTTRHSIRYSQQKEIEVTDILNEEELRKAYKIYLRSMQRNAAFPMSFQFIRELCNKKQAKVWIALENKQIISMIVVLFHQKYAHYFKSGNLNNRKSYANYALIWQAIQYSLQNGYEYFDFGATEKGAPLEVFKSGWGTQQYDLPIFSTIIRDNNQKKTFKNKILGIIWKHAPLLLIENISPYAKRWFMSK